MFGNTGSEMASDGTLTKERGVLHETKYDPASDHSLAVAIVQAVATLEGVSVEALQDSPLHDSIDIGAVESLLFRPYPNGTDGPATSTVTFRYRSYLITIRGDGVLQFSDTDDISL